MKFKSVVIGLAFAALAIGPAKAGDTADRFAVEGPGLLACSDFIEARADKTSLEYQRFIGFVEGYLSAANRYEPNTFDLSPWHNAVAFDLIINNHCSENPADPIVAVLQKMVSALRPIRIAQFSKMVEVGTGENKAVVYEAILRRAQAELRNRGLYSGEETGQFSPELREALFAYQKRSDLFETGVPDPATLWTLLNP